MSVIEYESDFDVFAVNDGTKDYYVRLSRLISDLNVVQLKRMEREVEGRRIIDLGPRTNTIDAPYFLDAANKLRLQIELRQSR